MSGRHRRLMLAPPLLEGGGDSMGSAHESSDAGLSTPKGADPCLHTVFYNRPGEIFGDPSATINAPEIGVICDSVKQLLNTHFGVDEDELYADWRSWGDRPHHLRLSNPLMLAGHEIRQTGVVATLGASVRTVRHTSSTKAVYIQCFNPDRVDGQPMAWMTRKYVEIDTDPDLRITNTRRLGLVSDNPVRAGQAAAAFNFVRLALGQRAGAYSRIPRLGEGEYYKGMAELGLPLIGEKL